jgi:mannitol 2-dehydrogenase
MLGLPGRGYTRRPVKTLRNQTLQHHSRRVAVPTYDRARLSPGVVHLSVGGFHRSHQAMYFDELAERGATDWGIVGVGLRRRAMKQAMTEQDCLYTVVKRGVDRDEARVVGVIGRYLFGPEEPRAVLGALTDPRTRLVTLTITAAAYHLDPGTGDFDARHPAVAADLARPRHPSTALGYVVEALDRRRRRGMRPFTVLSCDNVAASGAVTRTAVASFGRLRDPGLCEWIERNVAFPSSMVDRITPTTTDADRDFVEREFGVRDRWPVITEPFTQWVVEDSFCNGRPPLEDVGVQLVPDVRPYALIKTRMLNASHCALGYLGALAGHRRIDEVMRDPAFSAYASLLMRQEIAPLLPRVPGLDPRRYERTLLDRFSNPKIADRLSRLCRNGSAKVPAHVLSSISGAIDSGRPYELLTMAVAGWFRYLRGVGEDGREIESDDPLAARLRALAVAGGTDPRPLLAERALFGDLGRDPRFVSALEQSLRLMERHGARAAVDRCLASPRPLAA